MRTPTGISETQSRSDHSSKGAIPPGYVWKPKRPAAASEAEPIHEQFTQ
jgi:hypothetical protein